ncbi:cilia- and flagella-associated protein 69 [Calliopsis andreniformis]|uniref:cilia- and flagella-associated protein 69 n=1 Tax=Calliopsis andreniformis TaxID=337506 RepID=UPI003FCD811D
MILEWSSSMKFYTEIVLEYDNQSLLENFREHGLTLSLLKLINHILCIEKITTKEQRTLTLTLISIEKLMKQQKFYQEMYGDQSITIVLELLFRCLYQREKEIQIDQRLLLAIGSYIWGCIVPCLRNLEKFIKYGAVYIILDIIEIAPYPSQCLFLGILTDMCNFFFCGPYLCSWRGINKGSGLMSLLARVWREEEIRIKVKRCIDDEELPEIGVKQWTETYHTKLCGNISPAIIDTIGSVRSKIYSIRKIIEKDGEKYEIAKEHYKILYFDLPVEDRITISFMSLYFELKLGQVWVEISKYFEQVGITPLGMDGQAIFLMTQRYHMWGILIKERQTKLMQNIKREEEVEEKDEYARIRNAKLAMALDAFDELDYIYRTTSRAYMIKKKEEQSRQVDSALNFPLDSNDVHCHRTYQDNVMFTAIFDQHLIISSGLILDSSVSQMKILPVSLSNSYMSEVCTSKTFLSESPVSSTCLVKSGKLNKKNVVEAMLYR